MNSAIVPTLDTTYYILLNEKHKTDDEISVKEGVNTKTNTSYRIFTYDQLFECFPVSDDRTFKVKYICECFIQEGTIAVIYKSYALSNSVYVQKVMDFWTENNYFLTALKKYGLLLKNIPASLQTKDMCAIAVISHEKAFEYVSDNFKDAQMCEKVIKKFPELFKYVPTEYKTEEICSFAIKSTKGTALQFIEKEKQTRELCMLAFRENIRENIQKMCDYSNRSTSMISNVDELFDIIESSQSRITELSEKLEKATEMINEITNKNKQISELLYTMEDMSPPHRDEKE